MDLEYVFDNTDQWDILKQFSDGQPVPGVAVLTLLEGEEDESLDALFDELDKRGMQVSVEDIPFSGAQGQSAVRLKQEAELVSGGFQYSRLGEDDPLRLYLEEVFAFRIQGDEEALAGRAASGEETAIQALTGIGLQRVVSIAEEYVGKGVLLLDLVQEGSLALWIAISSGVNKGYCEERDRRVRNAMSKQVLLQARNSGLGQKIRQAMEDYRQVDERLLSELGRNATIEEIAVQMHMKQEEAEAVKKMLDSALLVQKPEETEATEMEREEDNLAVEDTAYFQMRQRIQELLSGLNQLDADILTMRFGLEKGLPMTPEETGRKLGLTAEQVVAREAEALAKLRME